MRSLGDYQYNPQYCVGEGAFGKVYRGKQISTGYDVAIKKIDSSMINKDQYLKDALDAEISILKQLNHPNIVRFMEKLSSDRSIYIVTEFCQDGDLRSVMKSANISEVKVFEIFCQLIEGFKVLQQKNIIHRDLKPANILNHNGIVKIADFGFAKFVNDFNNQLLRTCVGSPLYMSPQILQRQKYTTKSDIWSLGVIYYEMLFKTTPWNGYDENSLKENVLSQPLKIPDSGRLSKESTTFLIGALQKEEANRIEWSEVFSLFSNIKSNKKIPNISYFRKEKQEPTNIQIIQIQHQDSLSVQNTLKSKNIIRQQLSFTYFVNVEMIQNIIQINNSYQKELHFEMLCLLQARLVSLKYEYYLKEITQILQEQNKTQIFASYLNVIQKEFDLANELLNDTIQYFERTGLLIQLKQQSVEYSFIEKRLDDSKIVELENLVKTKILTLAKGILKQDANSITISYEVLSLLDYILDAMNISNSIKNNSNIDFEQMHDKHKYRNDLTKFADDIRYKVNNAFNYQNQ